MGRRQRRPDGMSGVQAMLAMRRGAHSHVDMAAGWSLLWGASSSVSSSMVVTAALQHGLARGRLAAGPAHGSMALEPLGQLDVRSLA